MKYLYQLGVILVITFIGEVIYLLVPLPIPASIYGMLLMLFCLKTGLVKLERVEETGDFMLEIMPIMFIPAAVGLITIWDQVLDILVPILVISIATSIVVMVTTGWMTQWMMKGKREEQ